MDQELKIILSQCAISTRMTALTFFPERFYMPSRSTWEDI